MDPFTILAALAALTLEIPTLAKQDTEFASEAKSFQNAQQRVKDAAHRVSDRSASGCGEAMAEDHPSNWVAHSGFRQCEVADEDRSIPFNPYREIVAGLVIATSRANKCDEDVKALNQALEALCVVRNRAEREVMDWQERLNTLVRDQAKGLRD